jgi:hypothetical protein
LAGGGGAPAGDTYGPFRFAGNLEGWAIDNSGEAEFPAGSSAVHSTNVACNGTGCVEILTAFDGSDGQLVSFSSTFGSAIDFTSRTLKVAIQRSYGSGGGGVILFAQSGSSLDGLVEAWTDFDQLDAGFVTLALPLSGSGFDTADVRRVGVRFSSGSSSSPAPGTGIFLVDDIVVE